MIREVDWLSPKEASVRLGITSHRTVELVHKGELPAIKTVLGFLFEPTDVDELARRRASKKQASKDS